MLLSFKRGLEGQARDQGCVYGVRVEVVGRAQPDYGITEEDVVTKDLRKGKGKISYYPIFN